MDETPKTPPGPFVMITVQEGKVVLQTNIPPENRSLVLWYLEWAKLLVLMPPQDTPRLLNAFASGMLKRMGRNHA